MIAGGRPAKPATGGAIGLGALHRRGTGLRRRPGVKWRATLMMNPRKGLSPLRIESGGDSGDVAVSSGCSILIGALNISTNSSVRRYRRAKRYPGCSRRRLGLAHSRVLMKTMQF
jgi:hypothetical protein